MTTLQGFIDELALVLRDIEGINFVPDDPVDNVPVYPAAIIYAESGRSVLSGGVMNQAHHDITVAVVTTLNDRPMAHRIIQPKIEEVTEAIQVAFIDGRLTATANIASTDYIFQEVSWGGVDMFGFFLTLRDVKIRRALDV